MNLSPRKSYNFIKNAVQAKLKKLGQAMQKRPFMTFLGLLVVLLIVVAIGNKLRQPLKQATTQVVPAKPVELYQLGANPTLRVQAKIEKSGVIKLVAQTSGVVQRIWKTEGQHVTRGTRLFSLSTTYQGGNVADLNRQMAQRNAQFLSDNYQEQVDAINTQRDIATKAESQASQLRSITRQSYDETNNLISIDQNVLSDLNTQIQYLKNTNVNNSNTSAILQLEQGQAGLTASLNGANEALRSNQYLANDSNEPAQIAVDQRDVALKQLDLQQHTLDLNKDLSQLNVRIAQVNESQMFPASPCPATVERVYVRVGQSVTSGTVLAELRGDMNTATGIVSVSSDVAKTVSRVEASTLLFGTQKILLYPRSISLEPTEGNLNSILFSIPEEVAPSLSDGSFVEMELPIGAIASSRENFIPIDAVYQTQDNSYVFVASHNQSQLTAQNRPVVLGNVYGQYVQVVSGLTAGDQVILNRNIVEGDAVVQQ